MGVFSGWQSSIQSAAATVAGLVGQSITALSIRLTQTTTNNAVTIATAGARLKFSDGGTTDYLEGDGSTRITAAGILATAGSMEVPTGGSLYLNGSTRTIGFMNDGTDIRVVGAVPLSPNTDQSINLGSTAKRWSNGYFGSDLVLSAQVGTEPSGTGITVNKSTVSKTVVNKVTITFAAVQTAGTTKDVTLWTLPAKTRVQRVVMDVTEVFDGGAISDCDVTVGRSAGGNEYILVQDVDGAIGTYGDTQTELGPGILGGASFASDLVWGSTTVVQCRFTSVGANLSELTTGAATFYIESTTFP